ncbi:hypothetical protein S245_044997, partial [Arachis hypogaea]
KTGTKIKELSLLESIKSNPSEKERVLLLPDTETRTESNQQWQEPVRTDAVFTLWSGIISMD